MKRIIYWVCKIAGTILFADLHCPYSYENRIRRKRNKLQL